MRNVRLDFIRLLVEETLARKGDRPTGQFWGYPDTGQWGYKPQYALLSYILGEGGWVINLGLSSKNEWRTADVDGVTQTSRAFLKSLREIVKAYPELRDWIIAFDGPYKPVAEILNLDVKPLDWSKVVFYHGTSDVAARQILQTGLRPRSDTGVRAAYGAAMSSAQPGDPSLVYLTTQDNMAAFASHDACRGIPGAKPVVLKIQGISGNYAKPDVDSREQTAEGSLNRIGSIGYSRVIPPALISVHKGVV